MLKSTLKCLVFLSLLFATAAFAAEPAGKVEALKGRVWSQAADNTLRDLRRDSVFYSGEYIKTGADSKVRLRFKDKTIFVLGPNSRMLVDTGGSIKLKDEGLSVRILKGAFRFVSGLIAKKNPRSMRVRLTVATIGIRGTHVAGEVFERREVDGEIIEASAKVVLLEPEEEGKKTAIEVSNDFGSVVIDKPGYGTEIPDEHSPPSPVRKLQIRSINSVMKAVRSSNRLMR